MTLATKITLARILFIPFFIMMFYIPQFSVGTIENGGYFVALILFVVLSLTDFVDGYIARAYNQVSDLGKFLDPLADKILVSSAMIMLLTVHLFPAWAIIAMLVREFIVAGIRMIAASEGIVIAADIAGKIKTILQMIALISGLLVLTFSIEHQMIDWLLNTQYIILTLVTLYSGYHYTHAYMKQKKER